MFAILLGIQLEVELLDHMVTQCLTFWKLTDCFPKWHHHLIVPTVMYEDYSSSESYSYFFFITVILVDVK